MLIRLLWFYQNLNDNITRTSMNKIAEAIISWHILLQKQLKQLECDRHLNDPKHRGGQTYRSKQGISNCEFHNNSRARKEGSGLQKTYPQKSFPFDNIVRHRSKITWISWSMHVISLNPNMTFWNLKQHINPISDKPRTLHICYQKMKLLTFYQKKKKKKKRWNFECRDCYHNVDWVITDQWVSIERESMPF